MCDQSLVGRNAIQAVRFQNALEEIAKHGDSTGEIARMALQAERHLCPICETPLNPPQYRGKSHDAKKHAVVSNHPSVWEKHA